MEFEHILRHVFELDKADELNMNITDALTAAAMNTNQIDRNNRTEKEHGPFSNEKTMLRNMIITVAHKIYLDRYFSLLRNEDTI